MTVQTKITFEVDYDSDEFENVNITTTLPQCDARWPDLLTLFADMLNEAEFSIDVENLNKVLEDYQKKQARTAVKAIQSVMGNDSDEGWQDNPGYQPVEDDTIVEVMFENGDTDTDFCHHYFWDIEENDIVKWRVAE